MFKLAVESGRLRFAPREGPVGAGTRLRERCVWGSIGSRWPARAPQPIGPADRSVPGQTEDPGLATILCRSTVRRTSGSSEPSVAYEHTMMAWIGTATSLSTFGSASTIFQLGGLAGHSRFPSLDRALRVYTGEHQPDIMPLATIEHRQNIRALSALYAGNQRSPAVLLAAPVSILRIVALLAMVFRK